MTRPRSSSKKSTTQPTVTNLTDADGLAFMSMCVQFTTRLVKDLETAGHCQPELYESLKGIQLLIDRMHRREIKAGTPSVLGQKLLDDLEKLG